MHIHGPAKLIFDDGDKFDVVVNLEILHGEYSNIGVGEITGNLIFSAQFKDGHPILDHPDLRIRVRISGVGPVAATIETSGPPLGQ